MAMLPEIAYTQRHRLKFNWTPHIIQKIAACKKCLYKKINTDPSNSEDIRFGFKAALICLEAAVFLLMDVLKAHSLRSVEKYANKSVVSSYHSKITQTRDSNYHRQSRSYRDLMKTQYDKTNQLEALIYMEDLEDKEYEEIGLKGFQLHRYIQDCRQVYHDTALAKTHGLKNPFPVEPGGPAQFEKELRYKASTASISPMQPI
jgi:hypothetical protein